MLNPIADRPRSLTGTPTPAFSDGPSLLVEAREAVELDARTNSDFEIPTIEEIACLLPTEPE